ncbi:hypothetical protein TNCV_1886851 [Trichonephila clavipes]|nr:hypothetical protein TNCV_1886851 [Trichonephila clavipes]
MAKKSSVLRQERRQTGGGEVPKEAELTDFEMSQFWLLRHKTPHSLTHSLDSNSTDIEISKPQYPNTSTSALLIPPVTPSQNTDKITEYDSSSDPLVSIFPSGGSPPLGECGFHAPEVP